VFLGKWFGVYESTVICWKASGAQRCVLAVTPLWAYHFPQVWDHVHTLHFLEFISPEHENWTHIYVLLLVISVNRSKFVTNGCGHRRYEYNFFLFLCMRFVFSKHACPVLTIVDFWLLMMINIHQRRKPWVLGLSDIWQEQFFLIPEAYIMHDLWQNWVLAGMDITHFLPWAAHMCNVLLLNYWCVYLNFILYVLWIFDINPYDRTVALGEMRPVHKADNLTTILCRCHEIWEP
jgi:hypothetical protein